MMLGIASHTFLLCSPSCSVAEPRDVCDCCDLDIDCKEDIWELREARSCLMTKVSSLISLGRSSNSVFRLATNRGGKSAKALHSSSLHDRGRRTLSKSLQFLHGAGYASPNFGSLFCELGPGAPPWTFRAAIGGSVGGLSLSICKK